MNFKTTAEDSRLLESGLSLKALGLLFTALSLPEGFPFTEERLASLLPRDGMTSVRTAIRELESKGYLVRKKIRDEKGKVVGSDWAFRNIADEMRAEG